MEEAREHPTLAELRAGNRRFLARREPLPARHAPKVAVLACADARVDPARIFDAEPGALFVVRTVGNVASREVEESLRFAAGLGVRAVVVLGHTDCAAVKDALGESPALPATGGRIRENLKGEREGDAAARAHARETARRLGRVLGVPVLAALYHTERGEVEWL